MARPSQNIDKTLLASGQVLYPLHGSKRLSVRQICEHAGANVGMFHYHFQSKSNYLESLLQGLYEEIFVQLHETVSQSGSPKERLRKALNLLAQLLRSHGPWIGRVWSDAGLGDEVARSFLQRNAPRHMGLLMALANEAAQAGHLAPLPPLRRLSFLMGAVLMPMLLVPAAVHLQFMPTPFALSAEQDVLSDEAIADRVDRALLALTLPVSSQTL
jgi:AcrR family transcriptional regulator